MTETGFQPSTQRGDWWSRRPRRSRSDSKVAGVAGGLGRYLGVDPILFRVGFVALTILGGAGVLAYCLLWLLLPADGDEVSAGESLIGRGRSSMSPVLAVGLAIAIIISVTSSFSWGLPFWPALVVAVIAFHIARRQRRGPFRPGSDWEQRFRTSQQSFNRAHWSGGQPWYGQQQQAGDESGRQQQQQRGWGSGPWGSGNWGSGNWGCSSSGRRNESTVSGTSRPETNTDDGTSPFDTPAFWDGPADADTTGTGFGGSPSGFGGSPSGFGGAPADPATTAFPADPFRKNTPSGSGQGSAQADPFRENTSFGVGPSDFHEGNAPLSATPQPRTTPPAWDPLGAAPFAWDLPDIELAPQSGSTLVRRSASPVIARATMGVAALTVAAQIIGMILGWWTMGWSAIAGTALAVVAVGLLVQALRGRSVTLIGPGVALTFATLTLALTGISGIVTVGDRTWDPPETAAELQASYLLTAGNGDLDLSGLQLTGSETAVTSVVLNAGQLRVTLPADLNVHLTCSGNAGQIDCLGLTDEGLDNQATVNDDSHTGAGTLDIDVHVGAGDVTVTR